MNSNDNKEMVRGRSYQSDFSAKREEGARTMKGGDWGDLVIARKLRVNVMGDPAPV